MTRCQGISVCAGRVLAPCLCLRALPDFDLEEKAAAPVQQTLDRLHETLKAFGAELAAEAAAQPENSACGALAEVQLAMLEDCCFTDAADGAVKAGYAPQAAVLRAAAQQEAMLRGLNDPYLSARAEDVHDLGVRLACRLTGTAYPSLSALPQDCIVAAHDLLPSMLMTADLPRIRGIAIETGTKTSHVSILASGLDIPTVAACAGAMGACTGEPVFLDGEAGSFSFGLTETERAAAAESQRSWQAERAELGRYAAAQPVTADGTRIEVHANIVDPMVLEKTMAAGICGVGLFRTEFLYMNRAALPTEDEQYSIYRFAAKKLGGLPLTIRTMDIGGDKKVDCMDLPREENPFMGYRAIRICLDRPEIFRAQLRAILRAGAEGSVGVMFPMIAQRRELEAARAALEQARGELAAEGKPCGRVRIGMMVEIPSAVVLLDQLAPLVDFVSIGSNDLTQYTYAADRMNDHVGALYDFLDPAVLRLIAHTIRVSDRQGIECSLCGEMAGDGLGLAALAALGIHKVSVSPSKILKTKERLTMLNAAALRDCADAILHAGGSREVRTILLSHLPEGYPAQQRQ